MKKHIWLQKHTIVALSLSILALAEIVDLTIVGVALPHLMGALEANINQISLTLTCYIVASAIFIPLTGFVTKKYGFKTVALLSAIVFGIASILCGAASTLLQMVVFRTMQGVGGAFLPALAQGYIIENFDTKERPTMMLIFSMCVVLGPIIGPLFGGYIVEHMSWRWIFYVNVPLCIISIVVIVFLMTESKKENIKTDYFGFLLMAIGIGCFEYFLDEGSQNSWFESQEMIILFAISVIALGFFIWRGLVRQTIIDFKLFTSKNFNMSCVLIFIFMIAVVLSLAYLPTLLQNGYGYPVDLAGLITAPRGVFAFLSAPIFIHLAKKIDSRYVLFLGLLIYTTACMTLTYYGTQINTQMILTTLILQGIGLTGTFVILMQIAFIELPHNMSSQASGMFNFFRNIGNSVGTSIAATVISREQQISWHDMASNINLHNHNIKALLHNHNIDIHHKLLSITADIQLQAFLIANIDGFYLALIALISILWIPFILKKSPNIDSAPNFH